MVLARVHRQCWAEAYGGHLPDAVIDGRKAPEFETLWDRRTGSPKEGPICIAEDPDGLVAGFASGGSLRADLPGYDGELVTLYVLGEFHRQGLGTEMFAHVAAGMTALGFHSLVAQVLASTRANGFYRRLGGELIEQREIDYRSVRVSVNYFAWTLR